MRHLLIISVALSLFLTVAIGTQGSKAGPASQTEIRTGAMLGKGYDDHSFYLRQADGSWERTYAGTSVAGRLMNFRAANALFDDEHSNFDPAANTNAFVSQFDAYRAHGILAMTVSLQGGNPGYEGALASAFKPDGSLKPAWMSRAHQVIEAADDRGMIIILTYFYQRQDQVLSNEGAVRRATINATDWLIANNHRNVIIEIANEHRTGGFDHEVIQRNSQMAELIRLAQSRFDGTGWRLPVTASVEHPYQFMGGLADAADVALVHGNGTRDWDGNGDTYRIMKELRDEYAMPIVMNEDNNSLDVANATSLAREVHALDDALRAGGSWGLMWRAYNQLYPMQWELGDPNQVTTGAGYFHAVLDSIQDRVGESDSAPSTPTATATPTLDPEPTATPTSEPAPTTPTPTSTPVPPIGDSSLVYSKSNERTNPQVLEGSVLSDDVYIFVSPDADIDDVVFSLNGEEIQYEFNAPFDFNGGAIRIAHAWNTAEEKNGQYVIEAMLIFNDGSTQTVSATFTIKN